MTGTMKRAVKFHGFVVPAGATVTITGYDSVDVPRWDSKAWDYVTVTRRHASILYNGKRLGVPASAVKEVL